MDLFLVKIIVVMLVAVLATTAGDIAMSSALKSVGELSASSWASFCDTVKRLVCCGRLWLALSLMCLFFLCWLTVLSRADLSLVLPITALSYVVNALLARQFLGEHLSASRWVGTLLIFVGVVAVVVSGSAH